jgi:hypothetical protein
VGKALSLRLTNDPAVMAEQAKSVARVRWANVADRRAGGRAFQPFARLPSSR